MDAWSSGALDLVAQDGILVGATTHRLVAVIELCKLMAADPGTSAASGSYPCCRGFGAWRWPCEGWTRSALQRRTSLGGAFLQFFIFFELIWGFILFDFWSPTQAERLTTAVCGRLSSFCFCYLL